MDWVFPLNSECLKLEPDERNFVYRPMADLLDQKDIHEVKYDPDFDHYVMTIHDRSGTPFPLSASITGARYFIEWLNSCGDASARKLAEFMEKFTEKLFSTNTVREVGSLTYEKTFPKSLSKETLHYIRSKPYIVNVHHVDKFRNRDQIVQLIMSHKAIDYWFGGKIERGITDPVFWRKFWDWGVDDWMSMTLDKFSGNQKVNFPPETGIDSPNARINIVVPDGFLDVPIERSEGHISFWKEVVVEKYEMYARTYGVIDG
jgi:hypothetical protein